MANMTLTFKSGGYIQKINMGRTMAGKHISFFMELGIESNNEDYLIGGEDRPRTSGVDGGIILYDDLAEVERPEDYEVGDIGLKIFTEDFIRDGKVIIYANKELKKKGITDKYRASLAVREVLGDTNYLSVPIDEVKVVYTA